MFPCATSDYIAYTAPRKPVKFPQGFARIVASFILFTYLFHLSLGQDVSGVVFTVTIIGLGCAVLFSHVGEVLCLGSKKEMFGVTAGGVIALMADAQTFGDRLDKQLVCETMGFRGYALAFPWDANFTIASPTETSCPEPTRISLTDSCHKAIFKRFGWARHMEKLPC